jgi:hypothetical protein
MQRLAADSRCLVRRITHIFVAADLIVGTPRVRLVASPSLQEHEDDNDKDDRRAAGDDEQPKIFHLLLLLLLRAPQLRTAGAGPGSGDITARLTA